MKKEVELKFFVDDLGVLRKKLKNLGAKFEWAGSERDFYFDTAGKLGLDFAKSSKKDYIQLLEEYRKKKTG